MNMRLFWAALTAALLFILVTSCQKTPDATVLALSQAENCTEAHPDSALLLLKRIPYPETLRNKAQADYALLMTQALDKNYVKPTSDSLISLAVGYYASDEENLVVKGKAYFYYGKVVRMLNRQEDGMRAFLQAKKILDGSKEYKMLGLISEEIGHLNWKQDLYEGALASYLESKKFCVLANDILGVSYELRNIGRVYLSMVNRYDSAYFYYQQALQVAHTNKCSSEYSILQELGMAYRVKGDYRKAEYYLLQALKLDINNQAVSAIYLSLGFTYLKLNDILKAEQYLKLSTHSTNVFTQIDGYNSLSRLEKERGDFFNAIEYREKSDSLRIIAKNNEVREVTADLQKQYENEKLLKENLQIKVGYKNAIIFSLILFFTTVLLVCYFVYKNHTVKRKIKEIEQTIVDNEEEISSYQQEMDSFKKQQSESDEHKIELVTEIAELDGKVALLSKHNKKLIKRLNEMKGQGPVEVVDSKIEDLYVAAFRIYLAIKNGLFNVEISNKDWERIFKLFDLLYSDFIKRLVEEFPQLTKHDLEICCLLKIGLSNEELSRIFLTTSDSTTKAKGRMKKRLGLSAQDNLEQFIYDY